MIRNPTKDFTKLDWPLFSPFSSSSSNLKTKFQNSPYKKEYTSSEAKNSFLQVFPLENASLGNNNPSQLSRST